MASFPGEYATLRQADAPAELRRLKQQLKVTEHGRALEPGTIRGNPQASEHTGRAFTVRFAWNLPPEAGDMPAEGDDGRLADDSEAIGGARFDAAAIRRPV